MTSIDSFFPAPSILRLREITRVSDLLRIQCPHFLGAPGGREVARKYKRGSKSQARSIFRCVSLIRSMEKLAKSTTEPSRDLIRAHP